MARAGRVSEAHTTPNRGPITREDQLGALLLECRTNREIARELGIAPRTVKAHLNRMFAKYGITDGVKRVKLAVVLYREQHRQG